MSEEVYDGGNKELKFVELKSPERSRTYHFVGNEKFKVNCVEKVCVRPSGSHRLIVNPVANNGDKLIIIKPDWFMITIDADKWTF